MSGHESIRRDSAFMRVAAAIGDLGSPFYAEERQRDVWNEAAAVGLQLALWLGYLVAAAFLWIGGSTGVPYALTVLALVFAVDAMTLAYVRRLGVELDWDDVSLGRFAVLVAVLVLLAAGFVRAGALSPPWGGGAVSGFRFGLAVGLLLLPVALVAGFATRRRRPTKAS